MARSRTHTTSVSKTRPYKRCNSGRNLQMKARSKNMDKTLRQWFTERNVLSLRRTSNRRTFCDGKFGRIDMQNCSKQSELPGTRLPTYLVNYTVAKSEDGPDKSSHSHSQPPRPNTNTSKAPKNTPTPDKPAKNVRRKTETKSCVQPTTQSRAERSGTKRGNPKSKRRKITNVSTGKSIRGRQRKVRTQELQKKVSKKPWKKEHKDVFIVVEKILELIPSAASKKPKCRLPKTRRAAYKGPFTCKCKQSPSKTLNGNESIARRLKNGVKRIFFPNQKKDSVNIQKAQKAKALRRIINCSPRKIRRKI